MALQYVAIIIVTFPTIAIIKFDKTVPGIRAWEVHKKNVDSVIITGCLLIAVSINDRGSISRDQSNELLIYRRMCRGESFLYRVSSAYYIYLRIDRDLSVGQKE